MKIGLGLGFSAPHRPGSFAYGASFDGTNDWLGAASGITTTPTLSALSSAESAFTISCWIKVQSAFGVAKSISSITSTNAAKLQLQITSTDFGAMTGATGGPIPAIFITPSTTTAPTVIANNSWVHLMAAYSSGSAYKVYVNGTSCISTSPSGNWQGNIPFRLGAHGSSVTQKIIGQIAEYWFNNSYLDPATNVDKFYASGKAVNLGANGNIPTGSAPVLYLPFSDPGNLGQNYGSGEDLTVNGAPAQVTGPLCA
ncbi:MAG: LamG domain-containing protein [Alphaproteobacteria bacterium]|nr:LamG domain-containing protein [Alphaproteobacteria bacterium]